MTFTLSRRRLLAAGASLGVTALSGGAVRAQSGRTKITFAFPFPIGLEGIEALAKSFMEKTPSIEVEVQLIPIGQVIPKLTAAFSGGVGPDCLAMSDAWLSQFARGGWLENLEPYISAASMDKDILPGMMGIARMYKNTAYYVPYMTEAYTLYYNKKHFAEAGIKAPPADLDEFRSVAMKLTDAQKNRYGYYVLGSSGAQVQQWTTWMLETGGLGEGRSWFDASGNCILAGDKHVEGLESWVSLYQRDKVSPAASATGTAQDQANAFSADQISMLFGWGGYLTSLAEAVGEESLGTALPPAGPAGNYFYFAGNGFSINAASPNKEAAWEFLQYILQPENVAEWNRTSGAIPANITTWNSSWLSQEKYAAPMSMLAAEPQLINHPRYLPGYASFQLQTAPELIQKTLLGRQTPRQHAEAVVQAINELRAKAEQ